MRPARETIHELYLDRINNYLTTEIFAEHNGLTLAQAHALLALGKSIHETPHPEA